MTDRALVDALAQRVLGWRPGRDRYLKPGASWIPRSRFRPLVDLRDAHRILDAVTRDYSLASRSGAQYTARVSVGGRVAEVAAKSKARAICLAVAQALEIGTAGRP